MKIYISIPKELKAHYYKELEQYQIEYSNENFRKAWNHLERAHIIGQKYPYTHSFVHWKMLQFGIRIKDRKEVIGQIPRLVFGGLKSFVGKVPIGNPGGANVPALKAFPLEQELQEIFDKAEVK